MLARFVRHRWESFKAGVVLVATLAPPVLLGMAAHDLAVTRYLERHLRDAGATSEALQPDDVIAVSGRISAMPVRMDEGTPQFEGALMVVRRLEGNSAWKRNRWRTRDVQTWVASSPTLAGWQLTSLLIQKAGFESYRASPCAEYQPPEGWSANCPGARYAIEQPDEDRRFSYEVTPIGTDTYTLIAAVMHTDRTLGLIRTDLSPGARPFAILVKGVQDGRSILADRAKVQIGWMVIWSAAIVLVAIGWMCVLSDRKGIRRVWGGTWRGLLVSAPFAALYWRYESDVLVAVDVTAAIAAITIAAVFGWRATHRQEKGAAR